MKLKLKKDIVIPAGTIFDDAPNLTRYASSEFVEATFAVGDSKDTYGSIVYLVGTKDSKERDQVSEYFEEITEVEP